MGSDARAQIMSGSGHMLRGRSEWIGRRREKLVKGFCAEEVVVVEKIPRWYGDGYSDSCLDQSREAAHRLRYYAHYDNVRGEQFLDGRQLQPTLEVVLLVSLQLG
jgi:hypothetical protein